MSPYAELYEYVTCIMGTLGWFYLIRLYVVIWRNVGAHRNFSCIRFNVVLQRWHLFPRAFAANLTIHFRFPLCVFFNNLFDDELVHVSYFGKSLFDGHIPVESRSGNQSRDQEGLFLYWPQRMADPVREDLFMFDFWCWCCWWINRWMFNFCLRLEFCWFNFAVDIHLFKPLFKVSEKLRLMLLMWWCGNIGSFGGWSFWGESN